MSQPTIGSIILNKYRIEQVIGAGGMGTVFCAQHMHLGDRVALKLLTAAGTATNELRKRFLQEAKCARKIRSEHAVKVTDIDMLETGELCMVMEYLVGTDLSKLPSKVNALKIETAVDYILQALDALADAHANGIIHRDLKPGNLFLTKRPDGTPLVKVLDFGVSRLRDICTPDQEQLTQEGTTVGTPSYMSPEQFLRPQSIDPRTDIWAIGVVLYNLLTRKLPFKAETPNHILLQVATAEPVAPSLHRGDIPSDLDAIILRCLSKDREARFPNAAALAAALVPFASPRVRYSLDRISSTPDVSGSLALRDTQPVPTSGSSPREISIVDEASTVPLADGRRSSGPDSILQASMSRTLDRIKAAAKATSKMVYASAACAIVLGVVVYSWRPVRSPPEPASATPELRPAVSAPSDASPPSDSKTSGVPSVAPSDSARAPEVSAASDTNSAKPVETATAFERPSKTPNDAESAGHDEVTAPPPPKKPSAPVSAASEPTHASSKRIEQQPLVPKKSSAEGGSSGNTARPKPKWTDEP